MLDILFIRKKYNKNINNVQASVINDIKIWDNLEKLKKIFEEEKEISNYKMDELDLCITIKEKDKHKFKV